MSLDDCSKAVPIRFISVVALVFLAINLITAGRSPTVWSDEVFFSDPAYHLARGDGFTSTTSPSGQPYGKFWAMNSPLHPFLLAGWIREFGFSLFSVRFFNLALVTTALVLTSVAAWRQGVVHSRRELLAMLLLVFCGMGMTFSYRSVRPESLGLVLASAIWLGMSFKNGRSRQACLVALGLLLPAAGVHLLLAGGIYGMAVAATGERQKIRDLFALVAGCFLGLGMLAALYWSNGVWVDWLDCLLRHSSAQKGFGIAVQNGALAYGQDVSFIPVALAGGIGLWVNRFHVRPLVRNLFWASLALPAVLTLAGNYPRYYAWIAYLPLAVTVFLLVRDSILRMGKQVRVLIALLGGIAVVTGLPARTVLAGMEWTQRDYAPVEELLKKELARSDVLYADYPAFYGSNSAARTYYSNSVRTPEWMSGVTVLALNAQRDSTDLRRDLGGKWIQVAVLPAPRPAILSAWLPLKTAEFYPLVIWRKVAE